MPHAAKSTLVLAALLAVVIAAILGLPRAHTPPPIARSAAEPQPNPPAPLNSNPQTVLAAGGYSMTIDNSDSETLTAGEFSMRISGSPASDDQVFVIDYLDFSADYNHSGTVDAADIFDFISAWTSGKGFTDFDKDSAHNPGDIFAFLNIWFNPDSAPAPIVRGMD